MPKEIERKYLLKSDTWKGSVKSSYEIKQGYLSLDPLRTVRVRVKAGIGILTIKSKNVGIVRNEYEYIIPNEEALELLELCEKPIIEKVRHEVVFGNWTWEVDIFGGENNGSEIAEVELSSVDDVVEVPEWIGGEVSGDKRYFNSYLIRHPFNTWDS